MPLLATGDENAPALQEDATTPAVMGGTATTGSGCLQVPKSGHAWRHARQLCTANYAPGCPETNGLDHR